MFCWLSSKLVRKASVFNPCQANIFFLFPLKTSGNLWYCDVFRGIKQGTQLGSTIDLKRVHVSAYALKNLGVRHVQGKNHKKFKNKGYKSTSKTKDEKPFLFYVFFKL